MPVCRASQRRRGSLRFMTNHSSGDKLFIGARDGVPVGLDLTARLRHTYLIGQTGTGKSTLLLNLIAQDMAAGSGLAVIDPHGDLAEEALSRLPSHRGDHLVYFNPSDLARPIGFNLLAEVPIDQRPFVADGIVSAFKHIWREFWGPRLEHIFAHALRSLMELPGATLVMLPRLLQDANFRQEVVTRQRDPVVRAFWQMEYAAYPERFREEAIAPILNKVGRVLMTPAVRNIVAQSRSSIDLKFMLDNSRVLIANLAKGRIGEGPSFLLGALLVTALAQAALSRAADDPADRLPFHLYVDEFQNFASEGFALILSEARKYGLSLTLAHQYLSQLPDELRDAVLGNVGSKIVFRTGAEDAVALARALDLSRPEALSELPNFASWASLLVAGAPGDAFRLDAFAAPEVVNAHADRLIQNSRIRFGRVRDAVERRIEHALGLPLD